MYLFSQNPPYKKFLCIYVRNKGHLDLIEKIISSNTDFHFSVVSSLVTELEFYTNKISRFRNIIFLNDISFINSKINSFDLFISLDAQNISAHSVAHKLLNTAKDFGTPTAELQHGLFQIGVNTYHPPEKNLFFDESLKSQSIAEHFLGWFESEANPIVIGYPASSHEKRNNKIINVVNKKPVISVLTNLHWKIYSLADCIHFLSLLVDTVNLNPNALFLWKRHPGEAASDRVKEALNDIELVTGVNISSHNRIVIVDKFSNVESIISRSSHCISTVSTTLLDIQMLNKPCAVFTNKRSANLMAAFQAYTSFNDTLLLEEFTTLQSSLLHDYDNSIFREFVLGVS